MPEQDVPIEPGARGRLRYDKDRKTIVGDPFGRQAEPVMVTLAGDTRDTTYWYGILASRAEFKGDQVQRLNAVQFKIFPRANND